MKWRRFSEDPYREASKAAVLPGDYLLVRRFAIVPGMGTQQREETLTVVRYSMAAMVAESQDGHRHTLDWSSIVAFAKR